LQRRLALKEKIRRLAERASANVDASVRRRFLQGLLRRLERTEIAGQSDPWAHYYAEIGPAVDKQVKLDAIANLLANVQADRVLDLGCNTGVFSLLAARQGARVIAIDSSEACIEALYAAARRESLPVTPLVADAVNPTPAFGFMGRQYPGLWQRVRSNTVLCLALMHHLHITGRQSFERIAEMLAEVTDRHLIFEFVARDDANLPRLPQRRKVDYTLDSVVAALDRHFKDIVVQPSDRATRRLLLCRKR
jgi:SAM-dependent methyltransferase